MSMKSYFLFLVLTYFICFLITPSYGQCPFAKNWSIYIYNGDYSSQIIDARVRSKDNDLGHHNITYLSAYKFEFCSSFLGNTLFSGDFFTAYKSAHFHVFDKEIEDMIPCKYGGRANVYWLLKDDGYYLSKEFKSSPQDPAWMFRGKWEWAYSCCLSNICILIKLYQWDVCELSLIKTQWKKIYDYICLLTKLRLSCVLGFRTFYI